MKNKVVAIMEMNAGKVLDEACNHYNDVYCDEVLYAAWAEAPRVATGMGKIAALSYAQQTWLGVESFMARLCVCQE
jgi:hypothetical protein